MTYIVAHAYFSVAVDRLSGHPHSKFLVVKNSTGNREVLLLNSIKLLAYPLQPNLGHIEESLLKGFDINC